MPGPTYMVHQVYFGGGVSTARIIRGGQFAEILGATGITGTKSDTVIAGAGTQRSTMVRFKGLIYAAHALGIAVLDPITGAWSQAHTYAGPTTAGNRYDPSDLIVVDTPSGPLLVGCHKRADSFLYFLWSVDGIGWSTGHTGVGFGNNSNFGLFNHKGIVYALEDRTGELGPRIHFMDAVTKARGSVLSESVAGHVNSTGRIFSVDDRLFLCGVSAQAGDPILIWEFTLGTWVHILSGPNIESAVGGIGAFKLNGAVYIFSGDNNTDALRCFKVDAPGGAVQISELTLPIPALLQAGSGIGVSNGFRLLCFVDTTTVPGSATAYVMFYPDWTAGAVLTLFKWNGEGTAMTVAASPQVTGDSGSPIAMFGGGEPINGLGTTASPLVTTSPEGSAQGTQGVVVSFSAWGDALVVPHDASGGAFTVGLVATQAPSGATGTILRVGPNEIWIKNDSGTPWVNGQAITDTSTGAANQSAVTTGGANDKTVEARYFLGAGSTGLGVPITGIATIVPGSVTGGDGAVEVGSQIQNVTADGRTFSFEWDFLSDGIPQALIDNLELFITRP